jgi:hypothetical protein
VFGANGFYIRHGYSPIHWFFEEDVEDSRAAAKMAFLKRHGVNVDLTT